MAEASLICVLFVFKLNEDALQFSAHRCSEGGACGITLNTYVCVFVYTHIFFAEVDVELKRPEVQFLKIEEYWRVYFLPVPVA